MKTIWKINDLLNASTKSKIQQKGSLIYYDLSNISGKKVVDRKIKTHIIIKPINTLLRSETKKIIKHIH